MNRYIYKPNNPMYPMTKKIISKVTESKSKQRRVTVPKEDETLEHGDLVELKKVVIK